MGPPGPHRRADADGNHAPAGIGIDFSQQGIKKLYHAGMGKFLSVQAGAAAALLALGGAAVLGWILREPALIRFASSFPGLVFNAALAFAMLGGALALAPLPWRHAARLRDALGGAVFALGAAVLLEYVSGRDLGLDGAAWQAWLADGNPRPGRMAPGVCVALMLCGAVVLGTPRVRGKAAGIAIQGATFLVFLAGFIGLSSYFLRLDLLYVWFPTLRMAVQGALALIVAALGLWSHWRQADWYRGRHFFADDEKTGYVGATILAVIALGAGVVGFAIQQATLEDTFSHSLQVQLRSQTELFQSALRHAAGNAENTARHPLLAPLLARLDGGEPAARRDLEQVAGALLGGDISALAIEDGNGRDIVRLGRFGARAATEVELGMRHAGALFWDDGLYLHSRIALRDAQGRALGALVVEQALPSVTEQFVNADGPGVTGLVGMCARRGERMLCFPGRQRRAPYTVARLTPNGQPTPMSLAIDGRAGVHSGMDVRGAQVLAAYGPLTPTGLGIIVRQDAAELFAPIREQLQIFGLLLIVLVVSGAALLRSQVTPMVKRLLRSEREASEREWHIQTVVDNVGEAIVTFDEAGAIESFNRAAARIFGYGSEEARGRAVATLLAPDQRALLADGARALCGGQGVALQGLHKDGRVFELELAVNRIRLGERSVYVAIARDITHQKRAERALQESEARSREITATLGEGIFVTDRDGVILFSNPAAQRLLGWSEAELLGRAAHPLLHHTHADGTPYPAGECDIEAVVHTGHSFRSHDDTFWRKDGSMLPVSVNANPILRGGVCGGAVVAFHDIVERKAAQRALEAESAKNAMLLRTASDGIHVLDPQGDVVQVNDAFCRMLGYTPEQMRGMNVTRWDAQWNAAELRERLAGLLEHEALFETRHRRADGSVFDVEIHAGGVVINGERLLYASARDISERKKAAAQVHHLAHFDILTDLPNRALLSDRLGQALAAAGRVEGACLGLLFIDLDKFKPVNDTLGHHYGDLLLSEVARRLQGCVRESDTVARVGGDEFVVLLPRIEAEPDALLVARKILAAIDAPFELEGCPVQISASIGIATWPQHGATQDQLVKSADAAMYHAKQSGGGAIVSFSELERATAA
jgi:diguanylate cyclase (GGDEF)-like protein/PAS domain S-box-containing protein